MQCIFFILHCARRKRTRAKWPLPLKFHHRSMKHGLSSPTSCHRLWHLFRFALEQRWCLKSIQCQIGHSNLRKLLKLIKKVFSCLFLKVSKSRKQILLSSILPTTNKNHYPDHLSIEGSSHLLFGRFEDTINCLRDLLTFKKIWNIGGPTKLIDRQAD